jgi:hypothetical protein
LGVQEQCKATYNQVGLKIYRIPFIDFLAFNILKCLYKAWRKNVLTNLRLLGGIVDKREKLNQLLLIGPILAFCQKFARAENKHRLLAAITSHSAVSWAHINLLGEYDFSDGKLTDSVGIHSPKCKMTSLLILFFGKHFFCILVSRWS